MRKVKKKGNKILFCIISFVSILLFLSYIHPTFNVDEEYTMGLIQHSFKQIFNINMLDVHPPTYYLLLKFFLQITTFYTHSMTVEVLFSRLFSCIAFIISFCILCKIVKLSGYNIKWMQQLVLYMLLAPVSIYATTIRMHEFSSLFNILEFYALIRFDKNHNYKNIIWIFIWAIIASYMDYYSAVCAGTFIFIYFIKYALEKNKFDSIRLFILGIVYCISSAPVLLMGIRQATYRQEFSTNESVFNNIKMIVESFTQFAGVQSLFIFLPFLVIIILSFMYLNKSFRVMLWEIVLNFIIVNVIAIFTCMRIGVYEPKLLYPQFSMYSFFLIVALIIFLDKGHFIGISIVIFLLCSFSLLMIDKNLNYYILPSIKLEKTLNYVRHQRSRTFEIDYNRVPNYWIKGVGGGKPIYITQESVYLRNMHKKLLVKHDSIKKASSIVNGKTNLFKAIFTNLKIQ